MKLTLENYSKGFLVDEELLAGVTEHPEQKGRYLAYVLRHTSGEYLGYETFEDLDQALGVINQVERTWVYEKVGGCGGCADGTCGNGQCGKSAGGGCKKGACGPESTPST